MSFVVSHFNRKLWKLQCRQCEHFKRTGDSDEPRLELCTRPEVQDVHSSHVERVAGRCPAITPPAEIVRHPKRSVLPQLNNRVLINAKKK